MSIEPFISTAIAAILGYVAFLERRMSNMNAKLERKVSQTEVEHLIDLHNWKFGFEVKCLREDVKELKEEYKILQDSIQEISSENKEVLISIKNALENIHKQLI